jgi:hypothetical protein
MSETDWKLLAVQRGIDLNICEAALLEIEEFRPSENGGDHYVQIAGFAMKKAREALKQLLESRSA